MIYGTKATKGAASGTLHLLDQAGNPMIGDTPGRARASSHPASVLQNVLTPYTGLKHRTEIRIADGSNRIFRPHAVGRLKASARTSNLEPSVMLNTRPCKSRRPMMTRVFRFMGRWTVTSGLELRGDHAPLA